MNRLFAAVSGTLARGAGFIRSLRTKLTADDGLGEPIPPVANSDNDKLFQKLVVSEGIVCRRQPDGSWKFYRRRTDQTS